MVLSLLLDLVKIDDNHVEEQNDASHVEWKREER